MSIQLCVMITRKVTVIKKFLNIFSSKKASDVTSNTSHKPSSKSEGGISDLINFVDYVVKSLVDDPSKAEVKLETAANGNNSINIKCSKPDIGKVIGKNGKTIMAIRALVAGAASRLNKQVNVEVLEDIAG